MVSQYYSLVADGDNVCSFLISKLGLIPSHQEIPTIQSDPLLPLTTRQTARLAGIYCCIAFIGSWAGNASLGLTTVASSTIISSISGTYVRTLYCSRYVSSVRVLAFFTLIIGRVFRVETLGFVKVGAVIMR
jgi:solute carrier family 35 protein F5